MRSLSLQDVLLVKVKLMWKVKCSSDLKNTFGMMRNKRHAIWISEIALGGNFDKINS